jgi:hypothetical protein
MSSSYTIPMLATSKTRKDADAIYENEHMNVRR